MKTTPVRYLRTRGRAGGHQEVGGLDARVWRECSGGRKRARAQGRAIRRQYSTRAREHYGRRKLNYGPARGWLFIVPHYLDTLRRYAQALRRRHLAHSARARGSYYSPRWAGAAHPHTLVLMHACGLLLLVMLVVRGPIGWGPYWGRPCGCSRRDVRRVRRVCLPLSHGCPVRCAL